MGDSIKLLVEKLIEGNAKMLLLSKQMYQQTLGLKEEIGRMREEIQKVKEIESESLQNLNDSEQSSEPSNRKLQSHKESMDGLDAAIEKKESDNREVSVKVNQVVVIDSPLSPEPPDVEINTHHVEIKSSGFDQHAKVSSRREPPAKPPDRSLALDMGGYARTDAERRRIQTNLLRPPPSPEPPDTDRLTTALLRQTSLHKTSYLTGGVYEYLCVIALDGEKDPEEIRVKLAFDDKVRLKLTTNELGIILNLKMGQIDKYMPSILPNHKLSHVSSSEQHTSTLLSYESSKAPGMYSTHTMQCELFIMRFIKWAVVGTLKLAQFNCPMIQKEMVIDDPTRDLFGIEVLTTKDFLVGEGLLPITWNSFISEYVQQERYVEVFKYFKKIQCADSHMLLSGNETHEYVRWICVIRDGTTNITAGGDLMNLKLREAFSGRVFWFMMLLQCLIAGKQQMNPLAHSKTDRNLALQNIPNSKLPQTKDFLLKPSKYNNDIPSSLAMLSADSDVHFTCKALETKSTSPDIDDFLDFSDTNATQDFSCALSLLSTISLEHSNHTTINPEAVTHAMNLRMPLASSESWCGDDDQHVNSSMWSSNCEDSSHFQEFKLFRGPYESGFHHQMD